MLTAPGRQDNKRRVEQEQLGWLTIVDVKRRSLETPGNEADLAMVQNRFKSWSPRHVATPQRAFVV